MLSSNKGVLAMATAAGSVKKMLSNALLLSSKSVAHEAVMVNDRAMPVLPYALAFNVLFSPRDRLTKELVACPIARPVKTNNSKKLTRMWLAAIADCPSVLIIIKINMRLVENNNCCIELGMLIRNKRCITPLLNSMRALICLIVRLVENTKCASIPINTETVEPSAAPIGPNPDHTWTPNIEMSVMNK